MLRGLLLLVVTIPAAAQNKPEDFMTVREGGLPIILSAPHGGRQPIPNALLRRGLGVEKFVVVRDTNTEELAEAIATQLEKKLGAKPFCVFAKFERKYADANRPAADAYESDTAKPIYELYHKSLVKAREAVSKKWGVGLVIDIHGQGAEANTIFRGTASGKSVKHLLDRHGESGLSGPNSIFGFLARQHITVHPAVGSKDPEARQYNGGFIVQTYGSADGGRIDAIQMEFGSNLRQKTQLSKTADLVAAGIAAYAREFLHVPSK